MINNDKGLDWNDDDRTINKIILFILIMMFGYIILGDISRKIEGNYPLVQCITKMEDKHD